MKNERVTVKKLERMSWRMESGMFVTETEIVRKPFGEFRLSFEVDSRNGRTVVEIKNEKYELFGERIESESYEQAKAEIWLYFERIEEAVERMGKDAEERAKKAYFDVINVEVSKRFALHRICEETSEQMKKVINITKVGDGYEEQV